MNRHVSILLFPDAEVLDFAGPFEVFSVASELHGHTLFDVRTVAQTTQSVRAVNGLTVVPDADFATAPPPDVLVVPGGQGARAAVNDQACLDWVARAHQRTELTLSVCTGALLLGKLGLLAGQPYCTHRQGYPLLRKLVPDGQPQPEKRFVRAGKIYTAAGIAAGIDLSLHVVGELCGPAVAARTADYMEYPYAPA